MAITPRSQLPGIKAISSRLYVMTPLDNGLILDLGPAGVAGSTGVFTIQFTPDVQWNGSIVVMGVIMGSASDNAQIPFLPVPYRRVTVNNVASDYNMVIDQITGATKIQVPSNGDAIGLEVSVTQGTCTVASWDMNGPSAV